MARPSGRKNRDFELKRGALAEALTAALIRLGPGTSLRDLAEAVDVTPSTLRHYFEDRDGVFLAVVQHLEARGQPWARVGAVPASADLRGSLVHALRFLALGWTRFGVRRMHRVGLGEGMVAPERGPAYVAHVLEPTLRAMEDLVAALVARGDLPPLDARAAGLALTAPVVLGLLHQDTLGGVACRPLDVDAFLETHVDHWLRGWSSTTPSSV